MSLKSIAVLVMTFASGLLVLPGTLRAGDHQVKDNAGLFRPGFVKLADEVIDDIHARAHKDLTIETFDEVPDNLKDQAAGQDKQAFYDHWLTTEARSHGVNGVFILVTKVPPHLQVGVGLETRQKAFTFKDRDELVKLMADDFHKHEFDRGLMQGVNFVRTRMAANLGIEVPRQPPTTQPASAPAGESAPASEPAPVNK